MEYEVTIGIPLFHSVDYIVETMESALAQTFESIEFLVVDDGGNDGSYEAVESLRRQHCRGHQIRLLRNSENRGVGYTRNRIIDEARGRYLYFLDSDDTIEPSTIEMLYGAVKQHQAEVAYGSYEIINRAKLQDVEVYQKDDACLFGDGLLAEYALSHVGIFHVSACNCLMDLSFLRQSGVRFTDARFWEDMAFTYELVPKVKRAVLFSHVTYHYLRHPGSLSHYQAREQLDKEEILANASTLDYLKSKCREHLGKSYLPYMCYNLELNSFYLVCHIQRLSHHISPPFTLREMRAIIGHPLRLADVLGFHSMLLHNILFWLMGILPLPVFAISITVLGKAKRAI